MPSFIPKGDRQGGQSFLEDRPEGQGPPSLWGQFKATVGAIPSGLVHMGADLGQDAYAITQVPSALSLGVAANMPGQAGADLVQGIHRNRFLRPFVGEEMVTNAAQGMGFTENVHASMPFMGSMGTSFRGTGERVVNQGAALAPGGLAAGDSQYGQAVREGNILPVLVEDVGNAALVTSGASKVAAATAEPAIAQAQLAEAAARATAPLETGGASAARSAATPGAGRAGSWFAREGIRPTVRDLARQARLPSAPGDALVQEAMQAPTARVFEVGGAGPAATTQVIDDAAATAARTAADDLAARAARLQRVARNLHTAARLGDTLADVPARVWTVPIGAAARGVAPAVGAVLRTAPGQAVGEYLDNTVGQAVRNQRARAEFRRFIHENGELPKAEGAGEIRQTAIAAERLLEDPMEGYAGHLVVSGVADTMGPIIRGMQDDLGAQLGVDPAVARRWAIEESLGDIDPPETFDPVDAFELADQYARTRAYNAAVDAEAAGGPPAGPPPPDLMPPEQMARIDQSQELLREGVRAARQSRFFRGKGESRGPRPEEEAARVTQEMLDRGAGPREVSAASEAAAAAARQREADLLATRQEQRGSSPLSVVVRKATERFAPKIDAAIDRVAEAQARAAKADERRIVDPEEFKRSVTAQVKQLYADAREVADTIVRTDPVLARTIAAPDPRIRLTDDQLADRLAGRLVSARGSRTPELRQLMEDLKAAGFEMPFDLPNPAALLPAERRAGTAERARVFARQAAGDEGTAATAAAQAQAWREKPQPIVEPRPGFASGLERAAVGATRARERAAGGPNVRDVDLEVRDSRRAAAAAAQGVEVRPGEPFRVPREKITGEAAMPQPLQSYTDADGTVHDGMLVELDMRGATLHPQVGGVSEVTPGRFMPNERVFLAYNDEGRAVGYLAVYGDTGLSIAVDPEARGQGVGVRLYEAAEAAGVDVHRNLADETFTADGARTYERFVNGPVEGEAVPFDRPVQREVFDKARRIEAEAETRDRIARQGEQQAIVPDEDSGPPPDIEFPPAPAGIDPVAWNRAYEEAAAEAVARPDAEWLADDTERIERVRQAANTAAADTIAEIDRQFGGSRIAYLPDLKPGQRRGDGNVSGAELEPVDAYLGRLSPNERAAWRKRWMVSKAEDAQGVRGLGADELALYQDWGGQDGSVGSGGVEEAFADFVALTERFDALTRIERGAASAADIDLAGDLLTGVERSDLAILEAVPQTRKGRLLKGQQPSDPNARRGRSITQYRAPSKATRLVRAMQQFIDSRAEGKIGPEPPVAAEGRRSPWEMSVEDYTAELTTAEATVAQWAEAHPWNPDEDFGPVEPPEVEAARTRINELAPQGFDDIESPLPAEELHARLVEAARTHGLAERETPGPARVFDPIARGVEAVADVEQRALEAFIEDAENRRVAKLSGQSVPREDYLYNTLNEPARRIYRQMVADTKVLTEEQRLELARRQLGQKLISRGRRAQAPISRQEGRVMARERILQSRAEQSAKAAERAQERVEAGPTRYEARTESMGRALGPFARGQRTVGLREGEARARELDLGREERTLIRLLDKQAEAERKARNSPEAAPARFATELRAGGNLKKAIEDQAEVLDSISDDGRGGDVLRALTVGIPQSVFDAVRIGGDAADPEHLIGGDFGRRRSGAALGKLDESLPYVRKTGQERIKSRTEGETDFTIRGQAIEEIKRHTDAVRNDLARRVQEKFGVRPDDLGVELRGRELVEEMKARDFVPWDPANPLLTPPPSQVTGQTTFIPRQLMNAFKKSSFGEKPRWQLNLETWYDRRFLGTIKTWWLALSPRWQLGNLVGNSLMSVIGGGIDPVTLVRQMRNARALLAEDPTGELLARQQHLLATRGNIPRTLLNRGMTHEEMTFLNPELDRPVRNPVARMAQKSYAMNEYTDNLFRSAVYLAKLEPRAHLWDQLDAGQISPEQFMAQVGSTLSARQALDGALHAAGDFQNLTPFERSVVKRLWIFYPWYRHITKLTLSLPVNHPTRVIWTLHLAQMFGDDDQDQLPGFLQGSIPLGGDRYLRTGNLNPFGGIESSPLLSPGSAVAGLTPAITWPAAILMGVDLSRGGAQISRPPGTERLDSYGRPTNTPLWRNPAELLRYAATQFPQGRAAYGALEDPVLRYGQGSPVLVQGETIPTGSSRASSFARLFGIPMPERIDVDAINQRRAERIAAARTARERYNENLSGAGAGR